MGLTRRKISTVRNDFQKELKRLEIFDSQNQKNFLKKNLSKQQLCLLTEALFFNAFRAYEGFVRDIFLLYCMGKKPRTGARVKSYLSPKSFDHAEDLIQSSMRFLDWASPDTVIERAELYLQEGFPVKMPYTTNLLPLRTFRRVRNHVAHNSSASLEEFKKVLKDHYGTIPINIPKPGEFLLVGDKKDKTKYKLLTFLELLKTLSDQLT
jgi:hypothetical protein